MASNEKKKTGFDIGIFVIVIVMLLFIGSVIFVISKDSSEEKSLMSESKQLSKLIFSSTRDKERMDKILNRTVTTGKFAEYEEAYKKYVNDCYSNYVAIDELLDNDDLKKYIDVKNYETDGPEFKTSLEEIRNYKTELTELLSKFNTCSTVDTALSYVSGKDEKSVEYKFYKDTLVNSIMLSDKDKETLEKNIKSTKEMLDNEEELLLFLKNNDRFWSVISGKIFFYADIENEYNKYLNKLK